MDNYQLDLAKYRIQKAKEDLENASYFYNNSKFADSLSASYYSLFHSCRALLVIYKADAKTHEGLISLFSQFYIKTGIFEKKWAKIISQALNKRLLSDYQDFYIASQKEAALQMQAARDLNIYSESFLEKNYFSKFLQLKVCGMRNFQNINDLMDINPGFMGFIFYEKSPRNVGTELNPELLLSFPSVIKKVGVFVNADIQFIKEQKEKYNLDYIQLHGHETAEFCSQLSMLNFKLIKAFSVDEYFDFSILKTYEHSCEYFLFDTKGKNPGGNGKKFDWEILKTNTINKPFFLSGGIELEDMEEILKLKSEIPNLFALDINSKFEISPAMKDVEKIKKLKQLLYANADQK